MCNNVDIKQELNVKDDECLRLCFFGRTLERIENLEGKSGEKEVLVGIWLRGREEKNVVKPRCFLPIPLKYFLPKMG